MKKLNKFFAVLVALAMMATLCVSMAFAVDKDATGDDLPAGYQASDATLYKVVEVPNASVTPADDATYTFSITAGTSDTVSADQMNAAIKNATFSLTEGEMDDGTATDSNNKVHYTRVGSQVIKNLFDFSSKVPGEYVYTIKETGHTAGTKDDASYTEVFTDDTTTTYEVHLYVDNTGNVTNVTIVKGDEKIESKVTDPTKIDPTDPEGATIVNKYERKLDTGKDPEGEDLTNGVLSVTKSVPGTQGDKTQQFKFLIKLDAPATETATAATPTWSSNLGTKPVSIPYGVETEFTLADGETLSFAALPAGVTYKITENLAGSDHANNYFAKMDAGTEGAAGANVDTGSVVLNEVAATNNHSVTNRFDETKTTPTGILISNLPYIVLALVAIGGLVAYVVVRRRNADEA